MENQILEAISHIKKVSKKSPTAEKINVGTGFISSDSRR